MFLGQFFTAFVGTTVLQNASDCVVLVGNGAFIKGPSPNLTSNIKQILANQLTSFLLKIRGNRFIRLNLLNIRNKIWGRSLTLNDFIFFLMS